jgi:hypothetical protein
LGLKINHLATLFQTQGTINLCIIFIRVFVTDSSPGGVA